MKMWLLLSLFLVFACSLGAESVEGPCADEAACCVCLCQAPSVRPISLQVKELVEITRRVQTANVLVVKDLLDKSFFHPPTVLA